MGLSIYGAPMRRTSNLLSISAFSAIALVACNSASPSATRDSSSAGSTSTAAAPKPKPGGSADKVEPKSEPKSGPKADPKPEPTTEGPKPKPVPDSGAAAVMPADVKRCEAHPDALLGSWTPTVDDIALAATALQQDVCLKAGIRESAIRACAAKAGTPETVISTDDMSGSSGCELQIGAIEQGGRRFVVFFGFFRSNASSFDGGASAVELTGSGPKLYLDALGKHGSLCPTTGGDPLKPEDQPAGWAELPAPTKDFLCKGSK
jgi:hypothetical protein